MKRLVVIGTHPVQYHAPVYRELQQKLGISVAAIYGSDFSVSGYRDKEFGSEFAWDVDLLSGYDSIFLSRISKGGSSSPQRLSARGLREALEKIRPHAVLLSGYSGRFYRESIVQLLAGRCPVLFRAETTDHAHSRNFFHSSLRDLILKRLYARFEAFCYIGRYSLKHFERFGVPARKLFFSPYCVDTKPFDMGEEERERYRSRVRGEWGIPESKKVILFSGKLSHRKGPDLLVKALKILPDRARQNIVVLFLGDGKMREELRALAEKEPRVRVVFIGFKNQTELSPFYHAADLLALPSRHSETWGLVVNEALHHGVPCVVSDSVGCAPDLVEGGVTGEICPSGSASMLAGAMEKCLSWAGSPDVRQHCRDKVGEYGVRQAAKGIAAAYAFITERGQ